MDKTSLGNILKWYENYWKSFFLPNLPIILRIDGRNFSKLTKNFKKPYDERMLDTMSEVTKALMNETGSYTGYTQSDEINLLLLPKDTNSNMWFGGNIQKIISVSASIASVNFNNLIFNKDIETDNLAVFDARGFQFPITDLVIKYFKWREADATKNAISSSTREYYSHDEVCGIDCNGMQELLWQKGINFNDYDPRFKRGIFVKRKQIKRNGALRNKLVSFPLADTLNTFDNDFLYNFLFSHQVTEQEIPSF